MTEQKRAGEFAFYYDDCSCGECVSIRKRYGVEPKFPPVVRAEDMHRECVRDEWQMARNPWVVRGRDHG